MGSEGRKGRMGRGRRRGRGLGADGGLARERYEGELAREREELARGKLTNGAPRSGAPLECFFYIAMAHQPEVRH